MKPPDSRFESGGFYVLDVAVSLLGWCSCNHYWNLLSRTSVLIEKQKTQECPP